MHKPRTRCDVGVQKWTMPISLCFVKRRSKTLENAVFGAHPSLGHVTGNVLLCVSSRGAQMNIGYLALVRPESVSESDRGRDRAQNRVKFGPISMPISLCFGAKFGVSAGVLAENRVQARKIGLAGARGRVRDPLPLRHGSGNPLLGRGRSAAR